MDKPINKSDDTIMWLYTSCKPHKNLRNERVTQILDKERCIKEQIFFDQLYVSCIYVTCEVLQYYFSGVKFRVKFKVLLQNNFGQSLPLKSLEIRLFCHKLNSRNRGNSLGVLHRNSPKYRNDLR